MNKILFSLAVMTAIIALQPGLALASDQTITAVTEFPIPTNEIIILLIGLVFSALVGCVGWIVLRLNGVVKKYLNIQIDAKTREYLETALMSGLAWAETKAVERAEKLKQPTTKDQKIGQAADYVIDRIPDALTHFGLDRGSIVQLIEARLEKTETKDEDEESEEEDLIAGKKP